MFHSAVYFFKQWSDSVESLRFNPFEIYEPPAAPPPIFESKVMSL